MYVTSISTHYMYMCMHTYIIIYIYICAGAINWAIYVRNIIYNLYVIIQHLTVYKSKLTIAQINYICSENDERSKTL